MDGVWYFYMDECPGVALSTVLDRMSSTELDHIADRLSDVLKEMGSSSFPNHLDGSSRRSATKMLPVLSPSDLPPSQTSRDPVSFQRERDLGKSSYFDYLRATDNQIPLRTLTGIFIQAWQQLTGINFIFYDTAFFKNSGISNPFLIPIATNIINVFMTLPGMWGVERFGRRRLLLVGAADTCVCKFLIAIISITIPTSSIAG